MLLFSTKGKATMTLVIPRKPWLSTEQRQALRLVGGYHSATKALLLAHGVNCSLLESLVRAGFVTIQPQVIKAGRKMIDVARVRITPAGRDVLAADN
jgi:hypothetical protein